MNVHVHVRVYVHVHVRVRVHACVYKIFPSPGRIVDNEGFCYQLLVIVYTVPYNMYTVLEFRQACCALQVGLIQRHHEKPAKVGEAHGLYTP